MDDALAVVETLISKCNEFNLPIWLASLDLKKAFDKITHKVIFEALRNQGIEEPLVAWIIDLYSNQTGCVDNNSEFLISRGVRQGDVLSSIIFNAALELIFQRWKAQLNHHGWMLSGPNDERLTNARYADDMLLFAKSLPELEAMLQFLHIELAACGLEMHQSKTKVLTNHNEEDLDFIDVNGLLIEILPCENTHRYLGRLISCSLDRSQFEIQHRLKLAWGQYH